MIGRSHESASYLVLRASVSTPRRNWFSGPPELRGAESVFRRIENAGSVDDVLDCTAELRYALVFDDRGVVLQQYGGEEDVRKIELDLRDKFRQVRA